MTTEFGSLLIRLSEERGLNPASLAAALKERGYEGADEDTLMAYMRGKGEVAPDFPGVLVQVLALDLDEQMALAFAFTFGQDR